MRVIALPEVRIYLKELSKLLYEKDYFGFEDSALKYVEDLFKDIETTLHSKVKKSAPPYFNKYGKGMQYSTFRKNKNTQWFVFFTIYERDNELIYLVRYITNNHVASQYL